MLKEEMEQTLEIEFSHWEYEDFLERLVRLKNIHIMALNHFDYEIEADDYDHLFIQLEMLLKGAYVIHSEDPSKNLHLKSK